ncbi:hypothetical protein BJ980_001994 [Nocardioides daedukensis]|uniref:Choice-of-anchor G family protein n=1 Tax=Nocardioides daedukensis TaxID=634462 RepID=A0A7Y9S0U5_9ACTN|nr:hypothetical protein [Nocardioides daedukensis]NYG59071.1 hypothetical protein [Nocardioides daedukensis]
MKRTAVRLGAASAATALVMLSIAPAHAATVSQAEAQAISLSIGGQAIEIESVLNEPSRAVNDGSTDVVTAAPKPLLAALDGQRLAITGALGQGAVAKRIEDTANKQYTGNSFACAGTVSNASGSPVTVGDNSCNFSDDPVSINFDNLLLDSGLEVIPVEGNVIGEALEPILGPLNAALAPLLEQLTGALVPALQQALAPLADLDLAVTLGAIESRCVANTGEQAIGESSIANASIALTLAGTDLGVIDLDTNVPPSPTGTPLLSSTALLDHILPSITDSLTDTLLDGALRPVLEPLLLDGLLGQLIDAIREPLLVPILDGLLTDALTDAGILSIVVNKHVPSANGEAITVTTLDIEALKAIEPLAIDLELGKVACGPNGTAPIADPEPTPEEPKKDLPDVPTKVTAGVDSESGAANSGAGLLAALLALGTAAGVVGFRRSLKS